MLIRYEPRDIAEIRVFVSNRFLCKAVDPDHLGAAVSLKDIQAARSARRRELRRTLNEKIAIVAPSSQAVVSGAVVDSRVHNEGSAADARGRRCRGEDQIMQIQVNTDRNVAGREEQADRIAATVEARLVRFGDYLTGVEVHLADESAGRPTGADHRCMIEARPAGRQPVAVTTHAPTVDESVASAISKLVTVLAREHDRRDHHKGSASIRTGGGEDGAPAAGTDNDLDAQPRIELDPAEG